MDSPRYRRRSTEVDAIQWTGDNLAAVNAFLSPQHAMVEYPNELQRLRFGVLKAQSVATIEPGDWIMRELDGSGFYPCACDVFDATYAPTELVMRAAARALFEFTMGDSTSADFDSLEPETVEFWTKRAQAIVDAEPVSVSQ